MQKNYYLVLGIASDATPEEIKEAYRSLAKAYHPDHYPKSHAPFLEIQEAYSVLSDPAERQRHDRSISQKAREPVRRPVCPIEPLVPGPPLNQDSGPGICFRDGHVRPEPLVPRRAGAISPEPLTGERPGLRDRRSPFGFRFLHWW